MSKLPYKSGYIIAKSKRDIEEAKKASLCSHIIFELGNTIYLWDNFCGVWKDSKYVLIGDTKGIDTETTGVKAYQSFYNYCGKEEVDKMKTIFKPIPIWESYEQMHYHNEEYVGKKIYKTIYEFDANSAFTYGCLQLPKGFEKLKEYMTTLYNLKANTTNKITRSKYKNMQNYLIGYFARIKDFVSVRSEIIKNSNINIMSKMIEIEDSGGVVYLSNTDSIVTDDIGASVMGKYIGNKAGLFKLEHKTDKLCYLSSNAYQIGEKVVYSGIKYFARQHIDLFQDITAEQYGRLVEEDKVVIYEEDKNIYKLCSIKYGCITVLQYNKIGELIGTFKYKMED